MKPIKPSTGKYNPWGDSMGIGSKATGKPAPPSPIQQAEQMLKNGQLRDACTKLGMAGMQYDQRGERNVGTMCLRKGLQIAEAELKKSPGSEWAKGQASLLKSRLASRGVNMEDE